MPAAFVLSGGAGLGAIHVGMLLALADEGERPDLIIGTSVGAVDGGWIASRSDRPGIRGLADLWTSLSRRDIFPTHAIAGAMGMLGRRSHLVPNIGLRRLLADKLEFARLEDAPIPLHVVATDVISGGDVLLSSGNAVDAERFEQAVDLRVIRPLCPVATSGADFSHAATLIERSHAATREWLAARPPSTGQAGLPEPHRH